MNTTKFWLWQVRSRLLPALTLTTACLSSGAALPPQASLSPTVPQVADIIIQGPIIIPNYPVIVVPRRQPRAAERDVTVQFLAQGDDWATIYLDDEPLFRAFNTDRNYTVELEPGAYRLEITGVSRFDVWGSGYLDVGRNDSHILVIRYGKDSGIRVTGAPYAWIPD